MIYHCFWIVLQRTLWYYRCLSWHNDLTPRFIHVVNGKLVLWSICWIPLPRARSESWYQRDFKSALLKIIISAVLMGIWADEEDADSSIAGICLTWARAPGRHGNTAHRSARNRVAFEARRESACINNSSAARFTDVFISCFYTCVDTNDSKI